MLLPGSLQAKLEASKRVDIAHLQDDTHLPIVRLWPDIKSISCRGLPSLRMRIRPAATISATVACDNALANRLTA